MILIEACSCEITYNDVVLFESISKIVMVLTSGHRVCSFLYDIFLRHRICYC